MPDLKVVSKYEKLLKNCDDQIRAGKLGEVKQLLSQMNLAQTPREVRAPLAKICRRAGLIAQGLRLLHPIIRNEHLAETPPSAIERSEYAVLLSRNGSNEEALLLLQFVDAGEVPECLMYRGFCEILKWNYDEAAGALTQFLQTTADDYTKLIARVNLAACYLSMGELERALELLNTTIPQAKTVNASRLVGNCLEIKAQVHFHQQDFSKARRSLQEASEIFQRSGGYDQLLTMKWQSIMLAIESNSIEPLQQFQQTARNQQHWESVRESDLFSNKVRFDQEKFDHLVFGTPMPSYRARIQNIVEATPSESYILGDNTGMILDLRTGGVKGSLEGPLNPGKKIHQCLQALCRDLYVPRNIGSLFAELYPGEYFNINSSPLSVRQWIHRTRDWLVENKIPACIVHQSGSYSLRVDAGMGFQMTLDTSLQKNGLNSNAVRLEELKTCFQPETNFTADQACEFLKISRSSFHRLVSWAENEGELCTTGRGRGTIHSLPRKKKAA